MAELGDRAGVGASTVNVIEKGSKQPRGDTVEKLARALDVPRCWLAYGDGQPPDWTDVNSAERAATPTGTEKRDIKRRLADLLAEVAALKAEVIGWTRVAALAVFLALAFGLLLVFGLPSAWFLAFGFWACWPLVSSLASLALASGWYSITTATCGS